MSNAEVLQSDDWRQRQDAVDIERSCIVQAPAGSGKTELLVQRILALLAVVETPEEVLSITFTRKAAGEMKLRLLQALERGRNDNPPEQAHAVETWQRARAVLARDKEKGWALLQNPNRVQLLTIDSFCSFITRRMPWLSRFGDQPKVTDDPAELYQAAAESLLSRLENGGAGQKATVRLLTHLDNRLTLLRDLLVAMLGRRDQWIRHLLARRGDEPRQLLESGLQLYVSAYLQHVHKVLGQTVYCELRELGLFAAESLSVEGDDHPLTPLQDQEDPSSLVQWQAVAHLVLTASGDIRKSVNKTVGFPADKSAGAQEMKARATELLAELRDNARATEALRGLRKLPETGYSSEQWLILEALIELLPLSVVELQEVFRLKGQVDFIEIAGAAHAALGSAAAPEELLLQLDNRISHILVDEFQDTSYTQYDLLRSLTAGWQDGDGRTLFVVGDPMQSIYRFREADVGLYLRVCQRGLDHLPMERIVLNTNFRSREKLVSWVNKAFGQLFPEEEDEVRGAVRFAPAKAFDRSDNDPAVTVKCFEGRQDQAEADEVVALVKQAQEVKGTVAVLVRSRGHLSLIVPALKEAGLRFQAQDIDPLIDRPVVQDLLSLTRALQHPADRVAWLSVLRAPWCGLSLADMTVLCGKDSRATIWQLLTEPVPQAELFDQISEDGRRRLDRVLPALKRALDNRGRLTLRRLIESTWLGINGPACVEESDLLDVNQVFSLLEDFDIEGPLVKLEKQLSKLFAAADPQAGPELQLMTIHKAKGLEFDSVILPGLGRGVRARDRALLRWLEHPDYELLLAPIPPLLSDQQEPTYNAIGAILQEKDDLETLRLLYVAATRAKSHLHLLGHAKRNRQDLLIPRTGSLLSVIWPACSSEFTQGAVFADSEVETMPFDVKIKRLPLQWSPPLFPESLHFDERLPRTASDAGHYAEESVRSRRTEEGRVVGTIVHAWLERIAGDGIESWTNDAIAGQENHFKSQLNLHGVPLSRVEVCAGAVVTCLVKTITSERGQWLLKAHPDAASELSLNGVVDEQLVRATIDRTFVDSDGVRWVVDYKTSRPESVGGSASFVGREAERYRGQLSLYAALFKQFEPGRSVRTALYFPFFDGWVEIEP